MTSTGTLPDKAAPSLSLLARTLLRFACRLFGHRWHFLHDHKDCGRVYQCLRCGKASVFIR
jgi:hypothetical protein